MHHALTRSMGLIQAWVTDEHLKKMKHVFRNDANWQNQYCKGGHRKTAFENWSWRLLRFHVVSSTPAVKRPVTSVSSHTPSDISCSEIGVYEKIGPTIYLTCTITCPSHWFWKMSAIITVSAEALHKWGPAFDTTVEDTPGSEEYFSVRMIATAVLLMGVELILNIIIFEKVRTGQTYN